MYRNLIPFFRVLSPSINPRWSGLDHYYTADSVLTDSIGTSDMTLYNGATYGMGIIGNAFSFNGVNQYGKLPDDTFAPTGNFTIRLWVEFTALSGWFCNIGNYSAGQGILFYITGNKIVSIISNAGNDIIGNIPANPTITTGTRHQVVLSHTFGVKSDYYIDGNLIVSFISTKSPAYPSPCPNVFGASGTLTNNCNCLIDEIALLDGELWDATQVTEDYNSGSGLQYPN